MCKIRCVKVHFWIQWQKDNLSPFSHKYFLARILMKLMKNYGMICSYTYICIYYIRLSVYICCILHDVKNSTLQFRNSNVAALNYTSAQTEAHFGIRLNNSKHETGSLEGRKKQTYYFFLAHHYCSSWMEMEECASLKQFLSISNINMYINWI